MEKSTPHCKLQIIRALIEEGKVHITLSAYSGASKLGLYREDRLRVVNTLATKNFYKSRTSNNNHKIWQDVYRTKFKHIDIYLKLTVSDQVLIVSFKEL